MKLVADSLKRVNLAIQEAADGDRPVAITPRSKPNILVASADFEGECTFEAVPLPRGARVGALTLHCFALRAQAEAQLPHAIFRSANGLYAVGMPDSMQMLHAVTNQLRCSVPWETDQYPNSA
jgi:hypothetical protein